MPYRAPGAPDKAASELPLRQTHPLLPPARQRRHPPADRRRISGVQRGAAGRGVPHLHRQDAAARARHDDRADDRRRDDAGRPRRLRRRADGARAGRLRHQHRREPLSRSALCTELHAASRLALRQRRRALRGGRHPDLRRAVPGDGAARDRRVHPRLPRALGDERSGVHRRVPLRARPRSARAVIRAARSIPSSPPRRLPACRSTPRRRATARSG